MQPSASRQPGAPSQAGFTLLAVVLSIAVFNIFLGVAVARWSFVNQRDREAELIWRGEQYSRALSCYLEATGVPPTELEELVEENCIRRLYPDPMGSSGEWKILRAADLGEEGLMLVAGLMGEGEDAADSESEVDPEDDAGAAGSGMRRSSLAERLRQRRSGSTTPPGEQDGGGSSRFGSRLGSSLGSEAAAGTASTAGEEGGATGRPSLRERAEGRLRDRLAARDLTGGRGRKSMSEGEMMSAILGISTSGSGEAIRTYMQKRRYEDWKFTLAGDGDQPDASPLPSVAPQGADGSEIQGDTEQRQSRFRRPSLRRGG